MVHLGFYSLTFGIVLPFSGLILHTWLLGTIFKYRNEQFFNTPFFHMLFSLHFGDLLYCFFFFLNSFFTILIESFGNSVFAGTAHSFLLWFSPAGNETVLVFIAVNRLINIMFPFKAKTLWTSNMTKISIVAQWSSAIFSGLPIALFPDLHEILVNDMFPVSLYPNSTIRYVHAVVNTTYGLGCSALLAVLYSIIVVRLVQQNQMVGNMQSQQQNISNRKKERKLAIQGIVLSLFVFIGSVATALWYMEIGSPLLMLIGVICLHGNFYNGTPIAMVMSPQLRKYMKRLIGLKEKKRQPRSKQKQVHARKL